MVDGLKGILQQYLESQYHVWDESLVDERRLLLEEQGTVAQVPFVEATPFYERLPSYESLDIPVVVRELLTTCSTIPNTGVFRSPYTHQAQALESFLSRRRNLIVATGTGSGKTETFLFPIMAALALEAIERPETSADAGCRALLMYPMNALVNDQLARLRRLFGNERVAQLLQRPNGRRVRFGMYTSRTPYPGQHDPKRDVQVLGARVQKLFQGITHEKRAQLEALGMWPAKDMLQFEQRGFSTALTDRELYTRHEMQVACPDLLVTNYSMLEYMLLRPVEASLFEQTASWLHSNPGNFLTVVLDEAHMYRGASGAEVALLLRRLRSRLDVSVSQLRFILTSASLGSGEDSHRRIGEFAEDLTGIPSSHFEIVRGKPKKLERASPGDVNTAQLLTSIDHRVFQTPLATVEELQAASETLNRVAKSGGVQSSGEHTPDGLRHRAFELCEALPVARHLANILTSTPTPAADLAALLFPGIASASEAVEGLVSIVTFGYSASEQRPFLPVRLHLLFRGLGGIYVCVDPACSHRRSEHPQPRLGRFYETPRVQCECGARVYELYTHRRCGAAFLRGFWREGDEQFLWHEPPHGGGAAGERLIEVHLLVETDRSQTPDRTIWLHKRTGRLRDSDPQDSGSEHIELQCATGAVPNRQPPLISYDGQCPVCMRTWTEGTQIMDLQTKGEAPFAYLVREQVRLQPPTREPSARFPNAGRKTLLFSDGRQKAARLARDIPRDVAKDSFRQLLVLAIHALRGLGRDAVPNSRYLYPAFLHGLSSYHLQLFDGPAATDVMRHLRDFEQDFGSDLRRALEDFPDLQPPTQYMSALLTQLGSPFYSLFALTLGFITPRDAQTQRIRAALAGVDPALLDSIVVIWIQNLLDRYAFGSCAARVREAAAGYVKPVWGEATGFRRNQIPLVQRLTGRLPRDINRVLFDALCVSEQGHYLIDPNRVRLNLAHDRAWHQCQRCTYLAPVTWQDGCPGCGNQGGRFIDPDQSPYLRTRKRLWRDPVIGVLAGRSEPFSLDVEEHTAQLGHRDPEDIASTTELYERRFRDVLIHDDDRPIDVLSCTTTMEVGIDIGSLVAVGLRNVPPQRQNYQQRAGRAGRRGSSLATVITYAQNNPHDNYYFREPRGMIAGEPPYPSVDASNPKLVQRHVNAQLLQKFFHTQISKVDSASGSIYSTWGRTSDFYGNRGEFALSAFLEWLSSDEEAHRELVRIAAWLPPGSKLTGVGARDATVAAIRAVEPREEPNAPDDQLLEFFFSHAVLPAYAFPRDLLSLRIEEFGGGRIELQQQPQQGLHIALSEYAPGRFVVVNKLTYQVGSVTANRPSDSLNRAAPLFEHAIRYVQCTNCYHTEELTGAFREDQTCRSCSIGILRITRIIQPEVAYPRGARPIDELSDDPIFTDVTAAQLPFPAGGRELRLQPCGARAEYAHGHNENLVVVNRGFDSGGGSEGFMVCRLCGHVLLPGEPANPTHQRDYDVWNRGRKSSRACRGQIEPVFLGYTFPTDLLLVRVRLEAPFNAHYDVPVRRRPLVDAVRSLSEALGLAASRELQIDVRELRSGFRFLEVEGRRYTDLFLYDALAGGAGYSTLAGRIIERIFDEASRLLRECDCSSSCNKCLRTYENRTFQTSLNRHIALELLDYARRGVVPAVPDLKTQALWLTPLRLVLQLEGWVARSTAATALEVSRKGIRHEIVCYPSLRDSGSIGAAPNAFVVSRYDVENRLPNVFAEIQ